MAQLHNQRPLLRRAGQPAAPVPVPISLPVAIALPFDQWPLWAKTLAFMRHETDKGLGDTVVHIIGEHRSDAFQAWFLAKFGKSCGCKDRQAWMNQRFPY